MFRGSIKDAYEAILRAAPEGLTVRQVARRINASKSTVQVYMANLKHLGLIRGDPTSTKDRHRTGPYEFVYTPTERKIV